MRLLPRRSKPSTGAQDGPEQAWICGRVTSGKPCRLGPSRQGRCQTLAACVPVKTAQGWRCRRAAADGGPCAEGPRPDGACSHALPPCQPIRSLRAKREVASTWLAAATIGVVALAITYAANPRFLMPGPITTAHSTLGRCSDCHTNIASGSLGWVHAVVATSQPKKDSGACLTCHELGKAALNPHGMELERLEAYTRWLEASAAAGTKPIPARVRNAVFPMQGQLSEGVFCATCHKEHQGKDFKLTDVANARCHSCHAVQFTSFHADHPDFDDYPFRRRTRIAFDHVSHFGKRFPETRAKKGAANIPSTCADCHTSSADRGLMGVKPFEQECSACHLKQIVGTERATGPKGIALITLPGLDVATLKEHNANIGEWPEEAEGRITPFMALLLGWDEKRRTLLATVGKLDLLDLSGASAQEIAAVADFAWEVKHLLYALTTAGTADVLKRLGPATGAPLDADLIAKLTANMPRDVLLAAQREWLPNLPAEIDQSRYGAWLTSVVPSQAAPAPAEPAPAPDAGQRRSQADPPNPEPTQAAHQDPTDDADTSADKASKPRVALAQSASWSIDPFGRLLKGGEVSEPNPEPSPGEDASSGEAENPSGGEAQTPEPAEKSEEKESAAQSPAPDELAVDAEAWAASGGWYRQDFSILYGPTGHADTFLRAWLDFTGRLYSSAGTNLAVPVFKQLTHDDAQGQCSKCHSIDTTPQKSLRVNWRPATVATRESLFTTFAHEPHFGLTNEKGCLTCHDLSDAKGFQETYKGHDPYVFVPNFKPVPKEKCMTCHGNNVARDDCLLCHKYHVNGVATPITATKVPDK